jgi:hypothetical protein
VALNTFDTTASTTPVEHRTPTPPIVGRDGWLRLYPIALGLGGLGGSWRTAVGLGAPGWPADDYLVRRHDYRVEVAGAFAAAQYLNDIIEADGVKLPSRRRAYRVDGQGNVLPDQLMVAIDVSDVRFE